MGRYHAGRPGHCLGSHGGTGSGLCIYVPMDSTAKPMPNPDSSDKQQSACPWTREYRGLLDKWRSQGAVEVLPDDQERRDEPRFKLKTGSITIQLQSSFPVYNLSRSGISFGSRIELALGQKVRLILAKTFLVDVEIISCEPRQGDPAFRIGSSFINPDHGLEMLVMLDEMGQLEMDLAPVED